jgi:hypothetical protein
MDEEFDTGKLARFPWVAFSEVVVLPVSAGAVGGKSTKEIRYQIRRTEIKAGN